MRDLIVMHTGGWQDDASLKTLKQLARAAASAVDDAECKDLGEAIILFAAELFSVSGHEKWAYGQTSGGDVLRLRILREIKAFQDRLSYLEAMWTAAGKNEPSAEDRRPKGG